MSERAILAAIVLMFSAAFTTRTTDRCARAIGAAIAIVAIGLLSIAVL